jgi:sulfate adenylyltransferase
MILAILTISDVWQPDKEVEAEGVFGTTDEAHPGVFTQINLTNPIYVGGTLEAIGIPPQHTFLHLRNTPDELRQLFADND